MNFNSLVFVIFFPIVLLVWNIVKKPYRWIVLLIASYAFYAWFSVWLLLPIFFATAVTYFSSIRVGVAKSKAAKNLWFAVAVTVCLGTLFVFKYLDFTLRLTSSVVSLFGTETQFSTFNIILPMGISFYTFQTMSYVIDVYRGRFPPEKHLGYYALFVVFFPQLVAGPIERPENLIPQLRAPRKPQGDDIADGIRRMIIGYIKKIIIADGIAVYVDTVYGATNASGTAFVIATVLFAIQIYCDFSGYTDIAIGCARLMGIRLMENFNRPYSAKSVKDFWRRWHISLSSWFGDYLYKPLGGNRKGAIRQCLNYFIVFALSGLWHGASLNFLLWGLLHAVYLVVGVAFDKLPFKDRKFASTKIFGGISHILTLSAVCFAWIFFRAETLPKAFSIITAIFTDFEFNIRTVLSQLGMTVDGLTFVVLIVFTYLIVEKLPKYRTEEVALMETKAQSSTAVIYFVAITACLIMWTAALSSGNIGGFIYFRF